MINVMDKTTRLELGSIIELRGNFKKRVNEEGEITYDCDMFRTKNRNETFENLYRKKQIKEAKEFLRETDWIYAKCLEEGLDVNLKYHEIVEKRKEARLLINALEQKL